MSYNNNSNSNNNSFFFWYLVLLLGSSLLSFWFKKEADEETTLDYNSKAKVKSIDMNTLLELYLCLCLSNYTATWMYCGPNTINMKEKEVTYFLTVSHKFFFFLSWCDWINLLRLKEFVTLLCLHCIYSLFIHLCKKHTTFTAITHF